MIHDSLSDGISACQVIFDLSGDEHCEARILATFFFKQTSLQQTFSFPEACGRNFLITYQFRNQLLCGDLSAVCSVATCVVIPSANFEALTASGIKRVIRRWSGRSRRGCRWRIGSGRKGRRRRRMRATRKVSVPQSGP